MKKRLFNKSPELAPLDGSVDDVLDIDVEIAEEAGKSQEARSGLVSKAAYKTLYAISFGVVFTSLLAAKLLVPKHSVIESALHDGAAAARAALEEKERLVKEVAEQTEVILADDLTMPNPA